MTQKVVLDNFLSLERLHTSADAKQYNVMQDADNVWSP